MISLAVSPSRVSCRATFGRLPSRCSSVALRAPPRAARGGIFVIQRCGLRPLYLGFTCLGSLRRPVGLLARQGAYCRPLHPSQATASVGAACPHTPCRGSCPRTPARFKRRSQAPLGCWRCESRLCRVFYGGCTPHPPAPIKKANPVGLALPSFMSHWLSRLASRLVPATAGQTALPSPAATIH